MPIKNYKPSAFIPSTPRTGDANRTALIRGKNMWIRGSAPYFSAEVYSGSEDLNETIPTLQLTGTLSFTAGSKDIAGAGTLFVSEIRTGQFIYAGDELLVVDEIKGDTDFTVHRAPISTAAGVNAYRMPRLFELDGKRGTLIWGNALYTEQGNIIAVGEGSLRRNGAVLPGTSLVASRSPKIAIYNPTAGTFSVYTLGLTAPAAPAGSNIAGGTRGMTAGKRSYRVCRARKSTGGYGNPSDPVSITTAAGEKNRLTFGAMDGAQGQDAWLIFGTLYESATSVAPAEGPWYKHLLIDASVVPAIGGNYDFEVLNSEISRSELLSFNNDAPTDAEFVASLIGYPIYVSCQGQGTALKPNGTSPGPFIVPAKPNNIEAAPLAFPNPVATSPLENIIGFLPGTGRIFLMTRNHLNFASFTGNQNFPVTIRPYWKRGFANPYSLCLVDKDLYASTTSGLFRSVSDAEEAVKSYDIGADVKELIATWNVGHRMVEHDPKNEAVCVFYPAAYKNEAGYWVTIVLPLLLDQGFWNPPIVIESNTRDMIVTGVARVGNYLEFVAGGKKQGSPDIECETYRFDTGSSSSVDWYLAWNFSDDGEERRAKNVKGYAVTGKFSAGATLQIHGARSNSEIDVAGIEAGTGSVSGAIAIDAAAGIAIGDWNKLAIREQLLYTARVAGTWNGSDEKDRVEEINLRVELGGFRK